MTDSVQDLAHDHREINRQVFTVGALLHAAEREPAKLPALAAALSGLHDLLFSHFAREEEALFPFLAETFAELAPRVHDMIAAHDRICGALTRALYLATQPTTNLAAIRAMYDRFELAYSTHASKEASLLHDLDAGLTPAQRATLTALIADL